MPEIYDESDIQKIGEWLRGAKFYAIQQYRPEKTLEKSFQYIEPYSEEKLKEFVKIAESYFDKVELRGLK